MTTKLTKINFLVDPATVSTVQETIDKTMAKLEEMQIADTNKDASGAFIKFYYGYIYDGRNDVKHYVFPDATVTEYLLTKNIYRDFEVIPSAEINALNNPDSSNPWQDISVVGLPTWSNKDAHMAARPFAVGATVTLTASAVGLQNNTVVSYEWEVVAPTTGLVLNNTVGASTTFAMPDIVSATFKVVAIDNAGNRSRPHTFDVTLMENILPSSSTIAITYATQNYTKKVVTASLSGGTDSDGTIISYTVHSVAGFTGTITDMVGATLTLPFTVNAGADAKFKIYSDTPTSGTIEVSAKDNRLSDTPTKKVVAIALVNPTYTIAGTPATAAVGGITTVNITSAGYTGYTLTKFKVVSASPSNIVSDITDLNGVALTVPFEITVGSGFKFKALSVGAALFDIKTIDNENDEYTPTNTTLTINAKESTQMYAYGPNQNGMVGNGTNTAVTSLTKVGNGNWKKVDCGYGFVTAIKEDGTLWSWGGNANGQLGQGDTVDRYTPTQIGTATDWKDISSCAQSSVAIKTDGTMWSWGSGPDGQLGLGAGITQVNIPTQIGTRTDWSFLSSGASDALTFLATITGGNTFGWGYNYWGQIGCFNTVNQFEPVQLGWSFVQMSTNGGFSYGIDNIGRLYTSGNFTQGNYSVKDNKYVTVSSEQVWKKTCALSRGVLIVRKDGSLWGWGYNAQGQLGTGNTTTYTTPIRIGSANDWLDVHDGYSSAVALKMDGSIWVTGQGSYGIASSTTFVRLGTTSDWKSIIANRANDIIVIN